MPTGRLRRADVDKPFHGVRVLRDASLPEGLETDRWGRALGPAERAHLALALAYAPRMAEGEFFSHITAAVILGIPLPYLLVARSMLHVSVFRPRRLPRSAGVRGHEAKPSLVRTVRDARTGLLTATPATVWASLGRQLTDPYDLVAAGDAVVRTWRVDSPLATLADLEAAVTAGRRVGVAAARLALPRVRTDSASRTESWLRLTLIDHGLPEPARNHEVSADGVYLGCVDLAYPDLKIAIEYEGEHHLLDPEQWARDIARYEALRAAGWVVVQITKAELFHEPAVAVQRVRAAIRRRG
ncbi:endonuclease domain-containing protein [Microbacterium trichothecenolyticum]|uniref:endonuclease domain-containing protein n=1 Tax=Microbacterium trichothecenolyticum TaxID=69370 RepID=UPI0035BE2432